MLDIKFIADNCELVKQKLNTRGDYSSMIDCAIQAYDNKREAQKQADELRNRRKTISSEIGKLKSKGEDISELMEDVEIIKESLEKYEAQEKESSARLKEILLSIPNVPDESVPVGADESANKEIKRHGEPRKFDFTPKAHYEIAEELDILDFERGTKIAGSGFTLYKGLGARLERALINFMIDTHIKNGYNEMFLPFMVNADSLLGTGQLPKFAEDLYKIEGEEIYLNPTAEVALANIYRNEILSETDLPISLVAYSPSFRKEAGSYGKDTRGIIRQHQFNKVELVKYATPTASEAEHKKMLEDAENILRLLGLPYRVVALSTGDLGFASAKTYDVEVWLPSMNAYKEISSVSNCLDFQARRADIRYRGKDMKKPEYVHTLNGSGLAVGRTVVAILENYQQADGSVKIPEILTDYMKGKKIIKKIAD
jgi:seryl-tRNA synthetase